MRTSIWLIIAFLTTSGLFPNLASAMLHPQQGQFMQRDPLEYVDGMSPYEAYTSNTISKRDPYGTQTKPATKPGCCCASNPTDCYIEFARAQVFPNPILRVGTLNNGAGRFQQFKFAYTAEIKSLSGASVKGCNLHQQATTIYLYLNPEDAKLLRPEDFKKSSRQTGYTASLDGATSSFTDPNDYVRAGVRFYDAPGFYVSSPGRQNLKTFYIFQGDVYVEEAVLVRGTIYMEASFGWEPLYATSSIYSSDGEVSETHIAR